VARLSEVWGWIVWALDGIWGFVAGNWLVLLTASLFALFFAFVVRRAIVGIGQDIENFVDAFFNIPSRYVWMALGFALILILARHFWPACPGDPTKVQEVLACSQINRNYGLILAGVAALFALYLNWQRTNNDRRRMVNDTYVKAIEQLGHEKMEVRLGAIYALERIARDAEDFDLHWSIMETLTAYIRERPASGWGKELKKTGQSAKDVSLSDTDEKSVISDTLSAFAHTGSPD
jgi:hypothetical protein